MSKLSHINSKGDAQMVNIINKSNSHREAKARALVKMKKQTLDLILSIAS